MRWVSVDVYRIVCIINLLTNNIYMEVVKDFSAFVESIWDIDYHEIYELYQIGSGGCSVTNNFTLKPANGSDDVLIIYGPGRIALRLTEKARTYFPKWIEENLMMGMDADSFYGMKSAMARDEEREERESRRAHIDEVI